MAASRSASGKSSRYNTEFSTFASKGLPEVHTLDPFLTGIKLSFSSPVLWLEWLEC
jgi:hypothetical protein